MNFDILLNKEIVNNARSLVHFYKIKNHGHEGSKKYFIKKNGKCFLINIFN